MTSSRVTALLCLSILAVALLPATASAREVAGPRTAGMAGTHRGVGTGNDTIFLNPAGMSLFPRYVVEGFWRRHSGRNETLSSVSVVDSRTGPVAGGLAFTYDYAGADGDRRSGSRLDMAGSYALADWLLMGTAWRYLHMSTEDGATRRVVGDVGLMLRLGDRINIGASGQNLVNPTEVGGVAPRVLGGGIGAIVWQGLIVAFDYRTETEAEDRPAVYSAGAEFFFLERFAVRGGWALDENRDRDQRVSLGASFIDHEFGLDASFGRSITGATGFDLAIGIRFFVN